MPHTREVAPDLHGPSAVGLTRLSKRLSFPPGGEALYRNILRLVDVGAEDEFVVVPCGRGVSSLFVAETTGAVGGGVDPDPALVNVASERATRSGVAGRLHFENARLDDLPYQDAVFDLAFGEIELGALGDPAAAVRELGRVTRQGGTVILIQLVWTRGAGGVRSERLVERLGVRPRPVAAWEEMLRDAGVIDLVVEDWSDAAAARHQPSILDGLAELLTFQGKLRLLPRAWKRWGWEGVRSVLSKEEELRRLLEDERGLGVAVIKGTRSGYGPWTGDVA